MPRQKKCFPLPMCYYTNLHKKMKNCIIKISDIELNKGQIDGLPANPRQIHDARFEALKKSIQDAPEMLNLRELLVFPHNDKFVVIGGNMRLKACKDLGFKVLPCKVLDENTPVEKLREYAIKDNVAFGDDDWDMLLTNWDADELTNWGIENVLQDIKITMVNEKQSFQIICANKSELEELKKYLKTTGKKIEYGKFRQKIENSIS